MTERQQPDGKPPDIGVLGNDWTFAQKVNSARFREAALYDAVDGLRDRSPISSAAVAFWRWQKVAAFALAGIVIVTAIIWPRVVGTILVTVATYVYLVTFFDRVQLFRRGLASGAMLVSDERARAIADEDLPNYTVFMPAYNEPEVVGQLVTAMSALEYPSEKLQVMLLLEADDDVTINAAREVGIDGHGIVTTLLVPPADPRTKPKACNYGLHFATGEIVTIFDAEDLPDPLQLRRVVAAFADLPEDTACVQGKLSFHNGTQNWLTSWFVGDYGLWFGFLLPGLMATSSPIPLGGTSNHLRRKVLDDIGAWDPFNVTEDADLGVRIAENGYRTAILESTTLEEANPDPINWIRQRSRWYKGYMQTWLVHTRNPVHTARMLGPMGTFRFTTLLAGTPLIACVNMVFWAITLVWFIGQVGLVTHLFPPYVYYPALFSLIVGNSATIYMNLVALREDNHPELMIPALFVPAYWVLMSIAALKGMWQIISAPSYWEKTFHGLDGGTPDAPENDDDTRPAGAAT